MAKRQKTSTRFEKPAAAAHTGADGEKREAKKYAAKRQTPDDIKVENNPPGIDFNWTTTGARCNVDRLKEGRCASQLVFQNGKTMLQLCDGFKKPGDLLPVKDAKDAQKKATDHCNTRGLGSAETGSTRRRSNPAWIAAGVAMGVMAAVLIKKRQAAPAAT